MEKNTTLNEKKTFSQWWASHKPSKRRIIQLYAALLTNANLKGFDTGYIYIGKAKYNCVPGMNCYSCPGATGACPLGALQNALNATNTKLPYYIFGILLLPALSLVNLSHLLWTFWLTVEQIKTGWGYGTNISTLGLVPMVIQRLSIPVLLAALLFFVLACFNRHRKSISYQNVFTQRNQIRI